MERLWSDFLNSEWHDWRGSGKSGDRLEQAKWQEYFLSSWGLKATVPANANEIPYMRKFREQLHELAIRLANENQMNAEDWALLNEYMELGVVRRQFAGEGEGIELKLTPINNDWNQALAEIAASFGQTLLEGGDGRIRICDNPDCRWVFYDDTRNRTKKYCDDKTCGNLMKVRRFRARKKAEHDPDEMENGLS